MIAAAVPLCGHIHLTCTNDPTVTNYCCRNWTGAPAMCRSARLALHPRRAGVRHGAQQAVRR
jgi:hypothetical protein